MRRIRKLIGDNSGKFTVLILILGVIIAALLAFWAVILLDFFYDGNVPWEPWEIPESWKTFVQDIFSKDDEDGEDDAGEVIISPAPTVVTSTPAPTAAPAPSPTPRPPAPTPSAPGEYIDISIQEYYPDISERLDEISESYGSVSVALVVYDGEAGRFFNYRYGLADVAGEREMQADTKVYIASLTKLITAICAMSLVDDNLISLDTDISNYFGYEVSNPNEDYSNTAITTRMLMQHTSSIFDSGAFEQSRELGSSESVRSLIERGSSFRRNNPGSTYEYSNFGYAVLGSLCERVSGKNLDTLAREVIFEPLGIDAAYVPSRLSDRTNLAVIYNSSHTVSRSLESQLAVEQSSTPGHDLHLAASNLTISAADYAKILAMLGNGGIYRDTRILSQSSVNEIHLSNIRAAGFDQALAVRYSAGNLTESDGYYWHTGSAYGIYSQFAYNIEPNRGVVVITNGASVSRLDNNLLDICTALSTEAWKILNLPWEEDEPWEEDS